MSFWLQLFDTSDFPARWTCGRWTAGHGWLHILSDLGIWSAYFAIPCVLMYFIWRRKDLPFRRIFLLFGAFILLCGTTHLMEAIIFWWPAYRLAGVIKLMTALVSWVTVIALMGVAPKVLLLKSPEELEQEVKKRTAELAAATNRLKQSEERLRLAVEATGVGIFDYDPATDKQVLSERAMEIWGFPPDSDTSGKAVLNAVHPDDRDRVAAATSACLNPNGNGVLSVEHRLIRPDGTVRWVAANARTVFQADGKRRAVRSVGTMLDITERKRLESDLRQYAAELSEADRRKDEFLATLAHELRNPLAPIRTGLEVMKMAKDDTNTLEEVRNTMERQTQQLITLVDDLLDVSRITRGKLELRKCRVVLKEVLQSAVEASSPLIDEAGHELTVTIPECPINLNADPHRLAQVVSNLLINAVKYTPEGGRISLKAERQDNEVLISVQDNGIGIPPEMHARVFEMFTQIDRPLEKGYTGLGIGLTLVKSLVEMHEGRIEVYSEGMNKGSEFRVRLPLLVESGADEHLDQPQEAARRQIQRKLLVVDDNKSAAMLLSMVVKMFGCDVRTAGDGEEAIRVAAEFLPDVILMDIGMPKMNGYEAARHIRQQPWGQKMKLVALTGWGQDEDKQRTKDAGFDCHLVKPAEPSVLQRVLMEFDSDNAT